MWQADWWHGAQLIAGPRGDLAWSALAGSAVASGVCFLELDPGAAPAVRTRVVVLR